MYVMYVEVITLASVVITFPILLELLLPLISVECVEEIMNVLAVTLLFIPLELCQKKLDGCDVCGGNNTCIGCDGVKYAKGVTAASLDSCGVCGGNNSTCAGCDGIPNSNATYDRCGICDGNNSCIQQYIIPSTENNLTPAGIAGIVVGSVVAAAIGILAPILFMATKTAMDASWFLPTGLSNQSSVVTSPLYTEDGPAQNPLARVNMNSPGKKDDDEK